MKRILSLLLFLISTAVLTLILLYVVQVYGGVELDMPEKMNEVFASVTGKNKMDEEHEAVDLGLSVKWATCNVGANRPEEYGDYYAWGETEGKDEYNLQTYRYCGGTFRTMTKYCCNGESGEVDNKTRLVQSDDVAHVKWGGKWRMPTLNEIEELCEKCSWEWTEVNEVSGYKVTGNNGNSIFLPAAGCRLNQGFYDHGAKGYYWSYILNGSYDDPYILYFNSSKHVSDDKGRYFGFPIRPVTE